MQKLHIDIETYSSINIKDCGAYKYVEAEDFEMLLVAYAFDDEPIEIVDIAQGEDMPGRFYDALYDSTIEKWAHNATFERLAFNRFLKDQDLPTLRRSAWYCSAIKAGYCGYPLGLEAVSKAMKLGDKAKLASGKKLIKYFCMPCKPTKVNGYRTRNLPEHDLEAWEDFKAYCVGDVAAEREIDRNLAKYQITETERRNYLLDQAINDRGILADLDLAKQATLIDAKQAAELKDRMKELTGLENPNSPAQLKKWLGEAMQKDIKSLAKDIIPTLIKEAGSAAVTEVLTLRSKASKTSTKKYEAILNCAGQDDRIRGLLQFYGATRTGRWAGRLVQVQNLPRNYLKDLELAREVIASGDYELIAMLFDNIPKVLSELIRTAFIAPRGTVFGVADFSAIEARVLAWLAGEQWRLDVFSTHGKIYEASASMMFNTPIDTIVKGHKNYELRAKGKVAELALGYQGATGALKTMGGEAMGLSESEMKAIVSKWRSANPAIVKFWRDVESLAKKALRDQGVKKYTPEGRLSFLYDGKAMRIGLPSGRELFYQDPGIVDGRFGKAIVYKGMNQTTRQWTRIDTYGGKLTENIVQAVARDLLAEAMLNLDRLGFPIVMHVHDEAIVELDFDPEDELDQAYIHKKLDGMCRTMAINPSWASGLPLNADGFLTPFYMKD